MNLYANEVVEGCLAGQWLSKFCTERTCFAEAQSTANNILFSTARFQSFQYYVTFLIQNRPGERLVSFIFEKGAGMEKSGWEEGGNG